ncbi:MAG: carbohydrate ABC transporter permease [Lentisphaerae bacterium]|nr:carbohydrate ABC transporter permease [Lentisphaerota bacterium]
MKRPLTSVAFAFTLLALAVYTLFPVYLMVKIATGDPSDIMRERPGLLLHSFTLEHFRNVLSSGYLVAPFEKSLSVAVLTALGALLLSVPAAYAISRFPKNVQYGFLLLIFVTRMFPEVGIALPVSVAFIRWNLLDTVPGLVLAHLIRVLPVTCWILLNTFETIPKDLEEAARVDGAGKLAALRHIVLPLALQGIAVAAIFSFLMSWDEFTYALYLCLSEPTLPLKVYYYMNRGNIFETATYSLIVALPVVVVTYALQKYLRSGYLAGAVKG